MPMTIPDHHANTHDGASGGTKPLILVVDDSNVARTFIRLIFQNDFEVHEASGGAEALGMLRTGAYNYSMASNYNRNCRPPVVFVRDGETRLVIRGETYDDLLYGDI